MRGVPPLRKKRTCCLSSFPYDSSTPKAIRIAKVNLSLPKREEPISVNRSVRNCGLRFSMTSSRSCTKAPCFLLSTRLSDCLYTLR